MKILDRYIFRQFIKTFLFTTAVFVCLFMLINMVDRLDEFMDKKLNFGQIASYYLFTLPSTLLASSPVSALLSSIVVAGRLSSSSELPAIRSAGVSMRQLLYPFLLGGTLISAFNILNSSMLAPAAFNSKNSFERKYFSKRQLLQHEIRNIHILEPGNRIISIGSSDPDGALVSGVSIEEFNGSRLRSRTDAASMRYEVTTGMWIMQEASSRLFDGSGEEFSFTPQKAVRLALTPHSLKELDLQPDEMNIFRHYRYLSEKRSAGFAGLDNTVVKLHTKLSMPLASLVVILIGVPLSAKKKRGGLAGEISISLLASFLFLGLQKTMSMAGSQGALDPALAAWLPDILFLGIGWGIYKTAID
ncbi:MAG: LPS export ABC transporter permease LptG [Chlorobiaceae bacterium]